MDVIYYYCYLFYKKTLRESEPHALTIWALGFGEGYIFSAICDIILMRFFCFDFVKYFMWPSMGFALFFNYLYFYKSKRSLKIIQEKPTFFGSKKISMILTIMFFTILISSMFWGPIYSKYIYETYCNKSLLSR